MSSKKPPKTRRQKIAIPKPAAGKDAPSSLRSNAPRAGGPTTESLLTVEQRQAIQAMAAQGLSKSTIAAALNIEGDLLQLEQLPETRVGRVANVLFTDLE